MAVLNSQLRLTLHDGISGRLKGINAAITGFQNRTRTMMAPMLGMSARIAAVGGAYLGATAGIRGTLGAAIDFESAFADVRKVVDANDEQFANMSRTIKQMSRELPLTAVEISQLFAAAGESGVATNELKAFSEMAARVGIAFDMSAGEAGDSLAKLKAQLGLTVAETGEMADAINHLSNNMASKASSITEYMLRVGKFAEMGGFAKEQIAAIGSAMISAGAQAETAGTAMMNVVRKMTTGEFAKKDQREAAKALGLDLPTLAKQMKRDAPKALKTVLKAIAKAPEEKQIALLSKFFGDEARAFAPLVGNIDLLDKALDSVADRTQYAGSAFKEFVARASTTENALKLLRNRIAYVFEDIGAAWLPSVKEGAAAIGEVLDSLGERATPFDKLSVAMRSFVRGLGYDGTIKDAIHDLSDLLFGKADGSAAADALGLIGRKFEDLGRQVRSFSEAVADNPIAQFLGSLGGYGFQLMLATLGIGLVAGAIRKLASALLFLSGAKAAVSILRTVADVGGALLGRKGATPGGKPGTPNTPGGGGKVPLLPFLSAAGIAGIAWLASQVPKIRAEKGLPFKRELKEGEPGWYIEQAAEATRARTTRGNGRGARRMGGDAESAGPSTRDGGPVLHPSLMNDNLPQAPTGIFQKFIDGMNSLGGGAQRDPIPTLEGIRAAVSAPPSGVQQVQVTNPPQIHAPVSVTVHATTNASPQAIGDAVGAKVKSVIEGSYLDAV